MNEDNWYGIWKKPPGLAPDFDGSCLHTSPIGALRKHREVLGEAYAEDACYMVVDRYTHRKYWYEVQHDGDVHRIRPLPYNELADLYT